MHRQADDIPWGAVAFVFVLSWLALVFALVISLQPQPQPEMQAAVAQPGAAGPLSQFWADAAARIPDYQTFDSACPVDGTILAVPNSATDNNFGGVTTDLMKIALTPAVDGSNRPEFELQEFEQKLITCTACGATFMAVDLSLILGGRIPGGADKIKDWDLARAVPGLNLASEPGWTYDVRSYLRYEQQKLAGYPPSELAFTALAGAYCSNFAGWYGREYTVPPAALYALAAASLRADLEQDLPEGNFERSTNSMMLGELYRLLGRDQESAEWFAKARELGGLTGGFVTVLEFLEAKLAAADHSLSRIPDRDEMPAPPFGWQVDYLLPSINSQLDQQREQWAQLDSVAALESAIEQLIVDRFAIE